MNVVVSDPYNPFPAGGGGGGDVVTLTGKTITYSAASSPYAGVEILNTGTVNEFGPLFANKTQIFASTDWIIPNGSAGADFEVYCTLLSGTLTGGNAGTWLNLGSTRRWWVVDTTGGDGTYEAQIELQIRRVDTPGTILATATYDLVAEQS